MFFSNSYLNYLINTPIDVQRTAQALEQNKHRRDLLCQLLQARERLWEYRENIKLRLKEMHNISSEPLAISGSVKEPVKTEIELGAERILSGVGGAVRDVMKRQERSKEKVAVERLEVQPIVSGDLEQKLKSIRNARKVLRERHDAMLKQEAESEEEFGNGNFYKKETIEYLQQDLEISIKKLLGARVLLEAGLEMSKKERMLKSQGKPTWDDVPPIKLTGDLGSQTEKRTRVVDKDKATEPLKIPSFANVLRTSARESAATSARSGISDGSNKLNEKEIKNVLSELEVKFEVAAQANLKKENERKKEKKEQRFTRLTDIDLGMLDYMKTLNDALINAEEPFDKWEIINSYPLPSWYEDDPEPSDPCQESELKNPKSKIEMLKELEKEMKESVDKLFKSSNRLQSCVEEYNKNVPESKTIDDFMRSYAKDREELGKV